MVDATTAADAAGTGTGLAADAGVATTTAPATTGVGAAPAVETPETIAEAAASISTTSTDWRSSITDPEHLDFAKRTGSVADLAKVASDLRKANGSMTRVPGPNASPEDIAKFNKLIGIPEAATEYKFDLGREATDQDRVIQGKLSEIFLTNRVPAAAAPAISKAVAELANEIKAEQDRVALQARENTTAELRKELGADYDSHIVLADRAVKQWGNPGFNELLNKPVDGVKLGDHPDFVRVFGSIGRRMGEGGFIGAVGGTERQSLQSELNALMDANPPGTPKYASPDVQRRVSQINEALHGTSIIGRSA